MIVRLAFPIVLTLFCLWSPVQAAEETNGQKVRWSTADGVVLVGNYHPPASPSRWTWVFLHGLGSVKEEWLPFVATLINQGDGFLIYDARGHGESSSTIKGMPVDYREWKRAGPGTAWSRMPDDLASAVQMLESRFKLAPQRLAVGGASLGANVAMVYASQHPAIAAVMMLSPGLEYAGIATEEAFNKYGKKPVLMVASQEDRYAFHTVQQLAKHRGDDQLRIMAPSGIMHGVDLFSTELTEDVLRWIEQVEKH